MNKVIQLLKKNIGLIAIVVVAVGLYYSYHTKDREAFENQFQTLSEQINNDAKDIENDFARDIENVEQTNPSFKEFVRFFKKNVPVQGIDTQKTKSSDDAVNTKKTTPKTDSDNNKEKYNSDKKDKEDKEDKEDESDGETKAFEDPTTKHEKSTTERPDMTKQIFSKELPGIQLADGKKGININVSYNTVMADSINKRNDDEEQYTRNVPKPRPDNSMYQFTNGLEHYDQNAMNNIHAELKKVQDDIDNIQTRVSRSGCYAGRYPKSRCISNNYKYNNSPYQ